MLLGLGQVCVLVGRNAFCLEDGGGEFVPVDQALTLAFRRGRPIFAIVSWGSFEDQSC